MLDRPIRTEEIRYWRDKSDHELDFIVLPTRSAHPIVIECKWKAAGFDPNNLKIFRQNYPEGKNFVVASDVDTTYRRRYGEIEVSYTCLSNLIQEIIGADRETMSRPISCPFSTNALRGSRVRSLGESRSSFPLF